MKTYPDFSEWLTYDKFQHELEGWREDKLFEQYAAIIDNLRIALELHTILEFGCGAGFVPRYLREPYPDFYVGLDKSTLCILQAHAEADSPQWLSFVQGDIRNFEPSESFDLVCSFAVLKHFSLVEFPTILKKFLALGKYGLFLMQVRPENLDDGDEAKYHHIWVTEKVLDDAIEAAGHEVFKRSLRWRGLHHGTEGEDWYIYTRRKK